MGTVIAQIVKVVKRDVMTTVEVKHVVVTVTRTASLIALRASAAAARFARQMRLWLCLPGVNRLLLPQASVARTFWHHAGHPGRVSASPGYWSGSPGC